MNMVGGQEGRRRGRGGGRLRHPTNQLSVSSTNITVRLFHTPVYITYYLPPSPPPSKKKKKTVENLYLAPSGKDLAQDGPGIEILGKIQGCYHQLNQVNAIMVVTDVKQTVQK